jgi:SAM-dependent methyltransferase
MAVSPVTLSTNTLLERKIDVDSIIELYRNQLGIDVAHYFKRIKEVEVYKCLDTGYRFYYPDFLSGQSEFYEQLQAKFDWYYCPWKWEHEVAARHINSRMKILEVGCGNGDFLKRLKQIKNINGVGLELNQSAVENGQKNGIDIRNQSLQVHAESNAEQYDVVCSFQVLEHVASVKSFWEAQLSCLKRGGKLIVSVPNNNSFVKVDDEGILNMPPHHMGLWTERSLTKLADLYNLMVEEVSYEPFRVHTSPYFLGVMTRYLKTTYKLPAEFSRYFLKKSFVNSVLPLQFRAMTIQVCFTKK